MAFVTAILEDQERGATDPLGLIMIINDSGSPADKKYISIESKDFTLVINTILPEVGMNEEFVVDAGSGGLFAAMGAVFWLFFIGLYLFFGWLLYRIAINAGQRQNAWWAFIPILNVFLVIKAAQKPLWWFVFFLVPFVNLIIMVILFWKVAEFCGKNGIWGVLMLVPFVNIVAMFVLAFSKPPVMPEPVRSAPRPRETAPTS
jgi:hypothetical protein